MLGPKFSAQDRAAVHLRREYSLNQVEYCRTFICRRHFPIHQIFERSCEMGLCRLTADTVAHVFGVRVHKRLRGKLSSVLDKVDHGHHEIQKLARRSTGIGLKVLHVGSSAMAPIDRSRSERASFLSDNWRRPDLNRGWRFRKLRRVR